MAAFIEAGHNTFVGRYAMAITLRLEGFYVDGVSVEVVGEHYVLITTARECRKTDHIITV